MTISAPSIQKNKKQREEEWLKEEVKFEFFNLEEPGVMIKFSYGPTNKASSYTMMHGGKYTYPRSVIQHLESRQVPIWGYKANGRGQMEKSLEGYKSRFQCRQIFE